MSAPNRPQVVCLGGIAVDKVYRLSNQPRLGGGAHILSLEKKGGGVEANVAAALARLEAPIGLIGRVGDDADGQWARDDLAAWSVDIRHVLALPHTPTDYCLVWVAPDGERMLACAPPALRAMQPTEADWAYLRRAQILFLSSFVPFELAQRAIQVAHQAGRFASALAALNCTQVGTRGGLATREQVERFLT